MLSELIEKCGKGDPHALKCLYELYAHRLKGVCRRYVHNEQDVNDILHDAFVIILTSFDRLRNKSRAEAWMIAITRNVAIKHKKHKDSIVTNSWEEIDEADVPTTDDLNRRECIPSVEDLYRFVNELPEGYGKVFRLSVFEGMSHKEIAEELGIEPHSSSSQLARAKKMLRKMMRQYWAISLLLLIPITFCLLKREISVKEESPIVAKQKKDDGKYQSSPKESLMKQLQEPVIVHLPINHICINTDRPQPVITHDKPDTLSNMIVQERTDPDTILRKKQADIPTNPQTPCYDIANLIFDTPIKKQLENKWQLALAYAGTPSSDMTRTDNYMTMPTYLGAATRSTKLYNWGDYMDYVTVNAPMMDSVSASNMSRVAIINSGHPSEPLAETKHHERPLTLQLSLSRQLNNRWSLSTGLSYTRMKSTFQGGNENTLIHRTQKIHYLGIPLRLNYRLTGGKRWSLYTSGGLQLDLPVSSTLSTQYIYGGPYADIDTPSAVETTINTPWQWSFGIGAGVQYEIVPHLKVYLEPSLNYYIPSSEAVETYRTEHPLDLSLPLGIRISW